MVTAFKYLLGGKLKKADEAPIYEIESLKRRYHRLLKLAKQEGLESSDIAVCYKQE